MNPLAFLGGVDLAATENWMQETEKVLVMLQCTEEQMVLFATYKLTRQAERWWTAYAAHFIELSHFTSYIAPDEVKKARQFERGLRRSIFKQAVVLRIQDFAELVNRAALAKIGERLDAEEQGQRKRSASSSY
ncbi:uncharacterized protein LOC131162687 [Malania oleifera]|uniref:uncharacterized protein LOC131162687 n=1 Tax=Malania oleifera TaxID=397392 RepID=UPI0025AE7827|nr:uncharacterized protein LOC131162687 [Malania oleifera]